MEEAYLSQMSLVIGMHDIRSHGHVVSACYSRLEVSWLLETDCGLSESPEANTQTVPQFRPRPLYYTSVPRSFATTVSQLKISDFSGETFKGFEVRRILQTAL